jgi:hypothetical protein
VQGKRRSARLSSEKGPGPERRIVNPNLWRLSRRSWKKKKFLLCRLARPETNFVFSFPKCGRTWLRLMLGHYLAHHYGIDTGDYLMVGELRGHPRLPRLSIKHDDKPYKRRPEELDTDKGQYRRDRVIFLCRDPRDVLVSHYYSLQHRSTSYRYSGTLAEYAYEERGSLATIIAYYNIWAAQRHRPRAFLCLRYEDFAAQPQQNLQRALSFIGVEEIDERLISDSVAYATFDNMRRLEEEDAFGAKTLRPGDRSDLRTYKTRKGIVGDHLNAFDTRELAWLDDVIDRCLDPCFGYGSREADVPYAAAT